MTNTNQPKLSETIIINAAEEIEKLESLFEAVVDDNEDSIKTASPKFPDAAKGILDLANSGFQNLLDASNQVTQNLANQKNELIDGLKKTRGSIRGQGASGEFSYEEKVNRAENDTSVQIQTAQNKLNLAKEKLRVAQTKFRDFAVKKFGGVHVLPSRPILLSAFRKMFFFLIFVTVILSVLELFSNVPIFERLMRVSHDVAVMLSLLLSLLVAGSVAYAADCYASIAKNPNKEEALADKKTAIGIMIFATIVVLVASIARNEANLISAGMNQAWNWSKFIQYFIINELYYVAAFFIARAVSNVISDGYKLGDINQYLNFEEDVEYCENQYEIADANLAEANKTQKGAVIDVRDQFTQDKDGNLASKENEALLKEVTLIDLKINEVTAEISIFSYFVTDFETKIKEAATKFKNDLLTKYPAPSADATKYKFSFMSLLIVLSGFGLMFTSCTTETKETSFQDIHLFDTSRPFDLSKSESVSTDKLLLNNMVDPNGSLEGTNGYGEIKAYKIGTSSVPIADNSQYILSSKAKSTSGQIWVEEVLPPFITKFKSDFAKNNFINTHEEEHSQLFGSIMKIAAGFDPKVQKKTLNIYSDLLENNGQISFYKTDLKLLNGCDSVLVATLVARYSSPIPNLNGIVVNLYIPHDALVDPLTNKDASTKLLVEASKEFYKKLFINAGATVNELQY